MTNEATKKVVDLDAVKQVLCEAIKNNLVAVTAAKTGNVYFEVKPTNISGQGLTGQFKAAWVYLKDSAIAEAATAERAEDTLAKLTPEKRRELLAKYASELGEFI